MRYHGGGEALRLDEIPRPTPGSGQVLVEVSACGVCRTDLHVIDDELPGGTLPIVPGHEIVGRIRELGREVEGFQVGERVGIPWLASTCGRCSFCSSGRENLCGAARFTGFHVDGGYADYALADARYCLRSKVGTATSRPRRCSVRD
jgi:propanol-preferring alcohol dehydrogenase